MQKLFLSLFLFLHTLLAAEDYDCVVIGSSPIPLFEALYQSATGKRVLLLEGDSQCGGAWRSIDMCGIAHVDLGCHHIGGNRELGDFLTSFGLKVVSMADPTMAYNAANAPMGLYFAEGCYELIKRLEEKIGRSSIELKKNCRLDNVSFSDGWAVIQTNTGESHRVKKIYHTAASLFSIEGKAPTSRKTKYCHLYLLIGDGGIVRFSYRGGFANVSRIMNLTPFVGLTASGLQLIVLQLPKEEDLQKSSTLLQTLKTSGLLQQSAMIIKEESYVYEQTYCSGLTSHLSADKKVFFESLDTSHLASSMQRHLVRWSTVLFLSN